MAWQLVAIEKRALDCMQRQQPRLGKTACPLLRRSTPHWRCHLPCHAPGRSRRGPTLRECVLMHAVARLALHPHITNIQASWVKMGPQRAAQLLAGGKGVHGALE